tara:strand:+ start:1696 stop:2121 length:426 start_codon:yes stop_codon:yes gene_type:complete
MTTFRGFSTSGNEFANVTFTDFELVKRDLMNNLNVRKGERIMRPDFGCVIWDMLFEPFTDDAHATIVDNIVEIGEADPRLEVLEVVPSSYEQGIQVSMTLRYIPADITEQLLYDFNQEAHSVLGGSISNNNQQTASAGTGY